MDAYDAAKWLAEIDKAIDEEFQPNEWEQSFLDSIRQWIESGKYLSQKQAACLEKIHQRATEGEPYR